MPKFYPSPLTPADLDTLTDFAAKANALAGQGHLAPMYCAADGGDQSQPHAWLFICWPAMDRTAASAGERVFRALQLIALEELGASMHPTGIPREDA